MQLRFIHVADIHLGYEQYHLPARANDFARAYLAMVDHAITAQVNFVLIAGDLFNRANTDAFTLRQAIEGLSRLQASRIPVVAIEGNHDAQNYRKHLSWMQFLCYQGLLTLLDVQRTPTGLNLVPFNPETSEGSYVDLAGARIYGMKYRGAATGRMLAEMYEQIEPAEYTVLALHAGMQGQVPHLHGGLTMAQINPLRPRIDYLALGHIHKRLMTDDWLFNPGSLETNSMEEIDWPHGFFEVQVDTACPEKQVVIPVDTSTLRPFRRISALAEGCRSVDEFVSRVEEAITGCPAVPEAAVIELHLGGVAEFRRQDVPIEQLKGAVEVRFSPLVVRVRNNLVPPGVVTVRNQDHLSRAELEQQVVERLVYGNAEYRDRATAWAKLVLDVKNMAIEKDTPASIADHVRASLAALDGETLPVELPALKDEAELEGR